MFSADTNIRLSPKPPSPPPNAVPQYCTALNDSGSDYMRQCLNYFLYVWMAHGNSFWIYPVDFMGDVLFCYAWDGSDWKLIRLSISLIDCFY
jgi:hypothetical protein